MKKTIYLIFSYILSVVLAAGCKGHAESPDHDHSHEDHDHPSEQALEHSHLDHGGSTGEDSHDDESHDGIIVFTHAMARQGEFALCPVQKGGFRSVIRTSGRILPSNSSQRILTAPSSGIVTFADDKTAEGSAIERGEPLFFISSKNMAEGDLYARTRAEYEFAREAYQRAEKLAADNIISQKEYQQALLNYQKAKNAFDALSQDPSGKGLRISSPAAGFVQELAVQTGQYVQAGEPLATLITGNRAVLRAEVSQKHSAELSDIVSANFRTPYSDSLYEVDSLKGRLLSTGKSLTGASSAFIPVTFEFENRDRLPFGSFVEIYLQGAPRQDALYIPSSALMETEGSRYVYVRTQEEHYRKQEVETGMSNGKEVEILSGLHQGETIVCRGAYRVKIASNSSAIPHGHEH